MQCPCGSNLDYDECCQPALTQKRWPATPLELMRSRYTAYCLKDLDWLILSWDEKARDDLDFYSLEKSLQNTEYTGLTIKRVKGSCVQFEASYIQNGEKGVLREVSLFVKRSKLWFYLCPEVEKGRFQ